MMTVELVPTRALGLLMDAFVASVIGQPRGLHQLGGDAPGHRPVSSHSSAEKAPTRSGLRVGRALVIVLLVPGGLVSYQVQASFGSGVEAFHTLRSFFQGALLSLLPLAC
jgi:hypothetical protein